MDRPVIFSTPMVQALMEGRKTVTRRLVSRAEPGDRLWVREACAIGPANHGWGPVIYRATHNAMMAPVCEGFTPWKPSIHMPRWASRITLHVEDVRREPLQRITLEDVWREGLRAATIAEVEAAWIALWDGLHPASPWASDPQVFRIAFRFDPQNIDAT